jgi:branched-chain amino acid transport system substrate-binding protein
MNRKIVIIIGIIIVVIVGYVFFKDTKTNKTEKPIVIGATLALSGNLAYIGEAEFHGMTMAVDEINARGGIDGTSIKLVTEDNSGEPKQAANAVSKMLTIDSADVIVSAFTNITNAVKTIVADNNKVMLYAATVRDIAESNSLFFRDYFDAGDSGALIAETVVKKEYKNVAFLSEISDQCLQYEQGFMEGIKGRDINIVGKETYNSTSTDLKTPLLKIKETKPDAIVVCAWRHEHILMKQVKEMGMIKTPILHWIAPFLPVANTDDTKALFEENKSVSVWHWVTETGFNQAQKDFSLKYQAKYGRKPAADVAYMYDDMYVLADAISICKKEGKIRDSQCISNQLLKTDYNGISGSLRFNEKGNSKRTLNVIRFQNGAWEEDV